MFFFNSVRKMLFSGMLLGFFFASAQQVGNNHMRVLQAGLEDPWSIAVDSSDQLWVTESKGYRVNRIDPQTGNLRIVLDLNDRREFPRHDTIKEANAPWPQGGLMGLALHPRFSGSQPYLYLAYVYKHIGGNRFMTRISRFFYDRAADRLMQEEVIDEAIPGSNDHNGGRLTVMEENGVSYLFYALGDMGAGQYANGGELNYAQDSGRKEGKLLRYLMDAEDAADGEKSWIPQDNPFNGSLRSAVYSLGHRNPQGVTWGKTATFSYLYACEHGPFSDDEVNIIFPGKNYGHPLIVGYADGNYNGLSAAASDNTALPGPWHTTLPVIQDEMRMAEELSPIYADPIYSFSATSNSYLQAKLKNLRQGDKVDWQSVAPSSIAFYNSPAMPEWKSSLLVTTLKAGAIYRLPLTADGLRVQGEPQKLFAGNLRYRDIAISNDGTKIYVLTDRSAVTSGPTEENPKETKLRGCLLEFRLK